MALSAEEFQKKLAALNASYRQRLPGQLRELEALADPVIKGNSSMPLGQAIADVNALAHKLGGSSGTFGLAAFSAAAHDIEEFTGTFLHSSGALPDAERQQFKRLLDALARAER